MNDPKIESMQIHEGRNDLKTSKFVCKLIFLDLFKLKPINRKLICFILPNCFKLKANL